MRDKQKGKSHHYTGLRAPHSSSRKGIGGRKRKNAVVTKDENQRSFKSFFVSGNPYHLSIPVRYWNFLPTYIC